MFVTAQPHEGARHDERRRAAPAARQRDGTKIEVAALAASAIATEAGYYFSTTPKAMPRRSFLGEKPGWVPYGNLLIMLQSDLL